MPGVYKKYKISNLTTDCRKRWSSGGALWLLALFCVAIVSCSGQKAATRVPELSGYEKNERVFETNEEAVKAGIYEEFVDSMVLKGKPAPAQERSAVEPSVSHQESPAPASGLVMGFRVQLGAFNDQLSAERFAVNARTRTRDRSPVYVRYYAPMWKVHAGDCRTRDEADILRRFFAGSGYPDAWIVSAGIRQ
ncbi:MAG: SPOR domain-containing protein [Gemmatimonadota bacterium]|nr:SPOR domain-containing protein [Gemmatimonadota bacterium]